jgi:hypothetical protein
MVFLVALATAKEFTMVIKNSNTESVTSQPRVLQLLERIDRTLLEIQLQSPTCRQVNILIERLSQANDGLDLIVQNQEAFIAAVEALIEVVERLRSLNLNADSVQVFSNEVKLWPKGEVQIAGDGSKPPQDKPELPRSAPGLRALRQLQRKVKRGSK